MARKFSKVERFVWRDRQFRGLSRLEKLLWHYLLTSPHYTSIPGLLPIPPEAVAKDMCEVYDEAFRKAFDKVVSLGWVEYDEDAVLIYLPKAISHNMPESPNVVTGWSKFFDEIPESPLRDKWLIGLSIEIKNRNSKNKAFGEAFNKAFGSHTQSLSKGFGEVYHDPSPIPEPENDPDKDIPPYGGKRARETYQYEYEGEPENDLQRLVKYTMETFKSWPQDQIELSLPKLVRGYPDIPFDDWRKIIREAHLAMPPTEPNTKCYRYVNTQIGIYLRNKHREKHGYETAQQRARRESIERLDRNIREGKDGQQINSGKSFEDIFGGIPEDAPDDGSPVRVVGKAVITSK